MFIIIWFFTDFPFLLFFCLVCVVCGLLSFLGVSPSPMPTQTLVHIVLYLLIVFLAFLLLFYSSTFSLLCTRWFFPPAVHCFSFLLATHLLFFFAPLLFKYFFFTSLCFFFCILFLHLLLVLAVNSIHSTTL